MGKRLQVVDEVGRPLHPDRRVQRGLATLALLEEREISGDLDPRRVSDLEESLHCHFTDNILSLFAANDLEALGRVGFSIDEVSSFTGAARSANLDDDFVAIGRRGDDIYVVTPREPEKDIADLFVYDASDEVLQPTTVANFLEECVEEKRTELRDGNPAERARADAEADDLDVADFRVALFRPRAPKRKVRHPKFGVGTVVDEEERGDETKLEIEFEDQTRKILASYVEPV